MTGSRQDLAPVIQRQASSRLSTLKKRTSDCLPMSEVVPDSETIGLGGLWYRFVGADGADDERIETEVRCGIQGPGGFGGGARRGDGSGAGGPARRPSQSDLRLEEAASRPGRDGFWFVSDAGRRS